MAKIVTHKDLVSYFGEEDHLELSQTRSFASLIYETLSEKIPTDQELVLFELILNVSIDHGTDTPSAIKTIEAAKVGKSMSESVTEGLLQINEHHGAAISPIMEIFYRVKESGSQRVKEEVTQVLSSAKKMPGFGHRIYKQELPLNEANDADPRTKLFFQKLNEAGIGEDFIKIAREIQQELYEQTGKALPINIDGSIAAVLCALGWEPRLGNAVFIAARTPGLLAQYLNNS
jgi:citrate synthase